jgi:hypothetical protein
MPHYSLSHVADTTLLRDLHAIVSRDRATTAELLAHIAEVEVRRLHVPLAYSSMFVYCVKALGFSEDVAFKRIRAARAARQFPQIFTAVAEGRLHVSGIVLLKPYLNPETAAELLQAAENKTKSEIERLLAHRFPQPDVATRVRRLPVQRSRGQTSESAQGVVEPSTSQGLLDTIPADTLATRPVEAPAAKGLELRSSSSQVAPGPVASDPQPAKVKPIAPERFALQVTIAQSTRDKLRRAQELLSHQIPSGNVADVLDRALDALIGQLEKRKWAATDRPRERPSPSKDKRHIPARIQRAVWERDGGCCTFTAEDGRRCAERTMLEFDHVDEVARGGTATLEGIRLRCRAHNQYTAEQRFGAAFMERKRNRARGKGAGANSRSALTALECATSQADALTLKLASP